MQLSRRRTRPINRVVKFLIYSDFAVQSGFGFIAPIFAVFIADNIKGATLTTIGVAEMVYLLTQAAFQIPIARIADRQKGEKDDFAFMLAGSLLLVIVPWLFILSSEVWHLLFIQFFYGLALAMLVPTWDAIFTRHLDKKRVSEEWGIFETSTIVGAAITAVIGGIIADQYGFSYLFILVSLFSLLGCVFLFFIRKNLFKKAKRSWRIIL